MNKDIKDLIPDWFKPESYSINKDFDLLDYFHNLRIRYLMTMYIPDDKSFTKEIKKTSNFELIQGHKFKDDFLNILNTAPLVKMTMAERERFFENEYWGIGDENLRPAVKKLNLYRDSIKPISWAELDWISSEMKYFFDLESSAKEKELFNLNKWPEKNADSKMSRKDYKEKSQTYKNQNVADILNEPLFLHLSGDASVVGEKAIISINLKSPDQVLVDDFKQFLKAVRKLKHLEYKKGKEITPAKIQSWRIYKAFEYFDLSLWFAIKGEKMLSDDQMLKILFPQGKGIDASLDTIRGTTRAYVDELRSHDFFEKIYWQLWIDRDTYLKVG